MEGSSSAKQKITSSIIFCGLLIGGMGGAFTLGHMIYSAIQMINSGKGLRTAGANLSSNPRAAVRRC